MTGTPLIDVRGLRVHAGHRRLVGPVDIRVERGERVGIVGPSGSGKTQLVMALLGLTPDGVRVTTEGAHMSSAVAGALFQQSSLALDPLMRVGRQVGLPLRGGLFRDSRAPGMAKVSRAERNERVRALLRRLDLPDDVMAARPTELSGGQRQRVALALAMVRSPELVIADEPTTALDLLTQAAVLGTLRRVLDEDGVSLVMVSHDLAVVSRLCDRILVFDDGMICEEGTAARLLSAPVHPVTRDLVSAARRLGVAG